MQVEEHCAITDEKYAQKYVVKSPRLHQHTALNALFKAAQQHDRYTCVMACGTGKTLVALWHAEQLQARKILVLLPSLGLLNQTLHEWLANTRLPSLKYLCVCSDQSVGNDEDMIQYRPEDLDFQVTTQSGEVTQFLSACASNDTVVIFSTYHSASVVGEALDQDGCFDLIIFDEAHKTAGEAGKAFSYALYDQNIKAKKRLFMTATPRILNPYQLKKHTTSFQVKNNYISMCDETLYGDVVYSLNFKKAVELGIIVDYKIIISVVTSEMVNNVLRSAKVKFKKQKIDALTVAHMLATQHAVEGHGINKLISFHSRVDKACEFQIMISEHWFDLLNDFNAQHVSGIMPASQRAQHINSFKNSKNSILTNARCLTEGIDVPVVDMIAFLCNKKSRVDIVQAAGRVMRKAPNKHTGYILIPFYIHSNNTDIEHSLSNIKDSDYADIWHILRILADYDENLKDIINVSCERENDLNALGSMLQKKLIVTGPKELPINMLKDSIQTLSIKNISDSWYYYYDLLKKFKQQHEHCNVSQNYSEDKKLGYWVNRQRVLYKKGDLGSDYFNKLDQLGFIWCLDEFKWQESYEALKLFKIKHSHCKVPRKYSDFPGLGTWLERQRKKYKSNELTPDKIYKLNLLKIDWYPSENLWDKNYEQLKEFYTIHGNYYISRNHKNSSFLLGWINRQRNAFKKGELSSDQIRKLNEIQFVWDFKEAFWHEKYNELKQFKIKNGHFIIPNENQALSRWVTRNRKLLLNGLLNQDKIDMLNAIGFVLDPKSLSWNKRIQLLREFINKHGHSSISKKYSASGIKLGIWVSGIRQQYYMKTLAQDKIDQLNKIKFQWDPEESRWLSKYQMLKKFKDIYGHCNVSPELDNEYVHLGKWVKYQKEKYKEGKLSKTQINLLNDIGFSWNNLIDAWNKKYKELLKFKNRYGHCRVPHDYLNNNVFLGRWVIQLRIQYRKKLLLKERINQLNQLGFSWDLKQSRFNENYQKLVSFYEKFGHCNVPLRYENDRAFGSWVIRMRTYKKNNKLCKSEIESLNKLNFIWDTRDDSWDNYFELLKNYKKRYGHCKVPQRFDDGGVGLGRWVHRIRTKYKNKQLSPEKMEQLVLLEFE